MISFNLRIHHHTSNCRESWAFHARLVWNDFGKTFDWTQHSKTVDIMLKIDPDFQSLYHTTVVWVAHRTENAHQSKRNSILNWKNQPRRPPRFIIGSLLFIIATEDLNANNMLGTYTEKYADDATSMVRSVYGTDIYKHFFCDIRKRCFFNQYFLNKDRMKMLTIPFNGTSNIAEMQCDVEALKIQGMAPDRNWIWVNMSSQ